MTASDTANGSVTSFNGNLGRWDSGAAPTAGNNYTNAAFLLRSPNAGTSHTFAGDALTLSRTASAIGRLLLKGPDGDTVTVNHLVLMGGLLDMGVGADTYTTRLAGGLSLEAGARNYINVAGSETSGTGGETLDITATLSGSGNVQIGGIGGSAQLEGLTVPTAAASNSGGTVKLSSANSFSGRVILSGSPVNTTRGGLQIAHLNALEQATLEISTLNSGTVPPVSFLASVNIGPFLIAAVEGGSFQPLSDTSGAAITLGIGGTNADSSFTGAFTGSGNLLKLGSGTLSLTGPNSYTGNTTVSGGVLSLGDPTLADTSTLTLAAGATLHLDHPEADVVAELILNGVSQADGVYNASNANGFITGAGSILVGAAPTAESKYRAASVWRPYDGSSRPASPAGSYFAVPFMPVSESSSTGSLKIAGDGQASPIHYSSSDATVVRIAASALRDDVNRVTGIVPELSTNAPSANEVILIGTIGSSPLIDSLVSGGKIDISAIQGKWEAYKAAIVENPLPGVSRALVIAGSDRRGTAFGVFALSESMGVSPWYWWGDVPVPHKSAVYIAGSHTQSSPGVKYRGIFLNDEDWGLQPWAAKTFETEVGNIGPKTYATIYELLLRLHANVIWPAMHEFPVETTPFYLVPQNKAMADDYAIVISTSHHEPMLRNSHEYDEAVLGAYNYWTNRTNIYNFWDERVAETADYENIYTLGLRGRTDAGMLAPAGTTDAQKAAKIQNEIIPDQRQMISDHVNADASEIPQIFIPYKETLVQYQSGLQLPDDVTILWPDDNHGYIRQLSNTAERARSGGSGVYYHLSYWGVPRSYLWLCTTPPGMTCSEMMKAWDFQADKMWLVNVGDLKPHEIGTEFFLRMARDPEGFRNFDQTAYFTQWAQKNFGSSHAAEIAEVLNEYFRLNIKKRPEHLDRSSSGFSLIAEGDEAQQRLNDFDAMVAAAEAIHSQLTAEQKPAFYEMILYPARGSRLVNRRVLLAERSRLWATQQRAATAALSAEAQAAHNALLSETQFYNQGNAGGKWNHMVSPMPTASLPAWAQETQNAFIMPSVGSYTAPSTASLGVVSEGARSPLADGVSGELPTFNRPSDRSYFIDVFNQGTSTMNWTAQASAPWITLSQTSGTSDTRIWVGIDWGKAPRGYAIPGKITIAGAGAERIVNLRAFYPLDLDLATLPREVDDNGSVSIEAEDFSSRLDRADGSGWRKVDKATASEDGMTILPITQSSLDPSNLPADTPSLTYQFHSFHTGVTKIRTECLPTHRITSEHPGQRFAISLNGETPKIIDVHANEYSTAWNANTLRATSYGISSHKITAMGLQTVKIWMVDPGVVLDRIVIEIQPGLFEAEDLSVQSSSKPVVTYTDTPASGGAGKHFQSTAVNDQMILEVQDLPAGDYQCSVRVKKWTSRGIVQMAVADSAAGPWTNIGDPQDLYNATELYTDLGPFPVSFSTSEPQYVRFIVTGKNASASHYWVLLDCLRFAPTTSADEPIKDWRFAFFGTTAEVDDAADLADPDQDGVSNLIEYATGSTPTAPSPSPVSASFEDGHLALTFNRVLNATDIIYRVIAGSDLPPVTSIWSSETAPYAGGSAASAPTTVVDPEPVGEFDKRFLVLKVTRP